MSLSRCTYYVLEYRRLKRYLGVGLIATTGGLYLAAKANDWNISTIGFFRFGRAALTVANITFDYKWNLSGMDSSTTEYAKLLSEIHTRSARKLLKMCSKNGGAFIKVGQHVGSMNYLVPDEYVDVLKTLHKEAPKSPLPEVMSVLKNELGKEPCEIFEYFSPEPIGAASIAQVHEAVLRCGKRVAVKVQHQRVEQHSKVDISTMEILVQLVEKLFPKFKFKWLAEETKKNFPMELDFLNEAKNAENIAKQYKKFKWLKIPEIYWDLSTHRVLTMEYCEGGQINDRNYIIKHNIDAVAVSKLLGQLYSEMIFINGVVHCDPHPGNFFISCDNNNIVITLLDHGLYRTLTDDFRIRYTKLWLALLNADLYKIKKHATALGVGNLYAVLASVVTARSWKSVTEGITNVEVTSKESAHIQTEARRFIPQITEILDRTPRDMVLILKTNDLLRGIEFTLTEKPPKVSFTTMSRHCVKAIYNHKLQECNTFLCKWKECFTYCWVQVKLFFGSVIHRIPDCETPVTVDVHSQKKCVVCGA